MLRTVLIVFVSFFVIILIYRLVAGYYPGSKVIIEDPPAEHNGLDDKHARIMFFYASWCPWSVKARPAWDSFKQKVKNDKATFGGKTVFFEEIDVESDKGKASLYNIKEYPTIKAETMKNLYLFVGIPTPHTIEQFSIEALGKKVSG